MARSISDLGEDRVHRKVAEVSKLQFVLIFLQTTADACFRLPVQEQRSGDDKDLLGIGLELQSHIESFCWLRDQPGAGKVRVAL